MGTPSPGELLEVAQAAALAAGRRTLDYFGAGIAVEWKADGSPRTRADLEAEEILRGVIRGAYPGHAILGEEAGEEAGTEPVRWIVDPIDGTRTFIRGVPLYGTLVGVEVEGEPVVGVIYLPALDEMVAAARGMGCTWNGRPCRVSDCARLDRALLVMSDQTAAERRGPGFASLVERTAQQRTWGDCYAYALVATGRAEIALDPEMSIWDSAALLPILEEAGGRFTDWSGRRTIAGPDALATNGPLHEEVLALLHSGVS
jgi:histidinol-phosphatase